MSSLAADITLGLAVIVIAIFLDTFRRDRKVRRNLKRFKSKRRTL